MLIRSTQIYWAAEQQLSGDPLLSSTVLFAVHDLAAGGASINIIDCCPLQTFLISVKIDCRTLIALVYFCCDML